MSPVIPFRERVSVTVQQAVEFTGISRSKMYVLVRSGDVESRVVCGRRLVLVRSLIRLVDGDRTAPDSPNNRASAA